MRFGKISAAMIAAAIMATSCAAMASAVASEPTACLDALGEKNNVYFRLLTEKDEEAGLFDKMNSKLLEVCGFRITATFGDEDWIGGGMGANSQSTGWKQIEWGTNGKTVDIKDGVVEWKNDGPIFKDTDTYAHLWFQTWSGTCKSVDKIELLDKDGNALWTLTNDGTTIAEGDGKYKGIWKDTDSADAAEEKTEETTEEATEEEVAEEEDDSAELEEIDDTDAATLDDIDWDSYDADAMQAMNDEFKLGGKLDLYAILGDDYDKLAKIDVDFVWTPGEKWCGGAGIANGVINGNTWTSGPEYGAANANEGVAGDGKATQTVLDITDTPIEAIAVTGDDGSTAFAELQLQKWWNCDEAGAQIAAIKFLDASGKELKVLTYEVAAAEEAAPVAETVVDAAAETAKTNPDTGIADVAAVAGLALVAGGAFIVAKKRK